jgi:hypothetical protein
MWKYCTYPIAHQLLVMIEIKLFLKIEFILVRVCSGPYFTHSSMNKGAPLLFGIAIS